MAAKSMSPHTLASRPRRWSIVVALATTMRASSWLPRRHWTLTVVAESSWCAVVDASSAPRGDSIRDHDHSAAGGDGRIAPGPGRRAARRRADRCRRFGPPASGILHRRVQLPGRAERRGLPEGCSRGGDRAARGHAARRSGDQPRRRHLHRRELDRIRPRAGLLAAPEPGAFRRSGRADRGRGAGRDPGRYHRRPRPGTGCGSAPIRLRTRARASAARSATTPAARGR